MDSQSEVRYHIRESGNSEQVGSDRLATSPVSNEHLIGLLTCGRKHRGLDMHIGDHLSEDIVVGHLKRRCIMIQMIEQPAPYSHLNRAKHGEVLLRRLALAIVEHVNLGDDDGYIGAEE